MIMKNIVTISLLFISFYSCVRAQQPYGLCSQVYQMYHYCTNASPAVSTVTANVVETKIWKKGPKGDRGSPAVVNYTSINSRIDEKMKDIETQVDEFGSDLMKKHEIFVNETKNDEEIQNAAINEINVNIASLSSTLEEMTNKTQHIEIQVDEFGSNLKKKHEIFVNETKKDEKLQNDVINEINEKISSLSSTLEEMTNRMQHVETQVDEFESDLMKKHEIFVNEAKKDEKIQNEGINGVNRKISSLSWTMEEMKNRMQHTCPILYNNKCFLPVMNEEATLDEARDICAEMSGKLANIYSMKQFDFLMKQIRANHLNGKSYVSLRLGMTIEPSTGQVSLTDGTKVTYLNKWYPDNPEKYSISTSVMLQVHQSATDVYQYLFNVPPIYRSNILCEI